MNRALLYLVLPWALISRLGVCTAQTVTRVAAGQGHSLFMMSDGSLWGMGDNGLGELGLGQTVSGVNNPQMILSSNVTAVACGAYFSLFVKSGGSLWAMGDNGNGQLGDGSFNQQNVPEQIVGSLVSVIGAGAASEQSLFTEFRFNIRGSLWTMGLNDAGELGDGTVVTTNTPQNIVTASAFGSPAATAAAGGDAHSLFIAPGGKLWGMGDNAVGELGLGNGFPGTNRPVEVVSSNVTAIAAGYFYSLFLKSDGSLWAMGQNDSGQLGDGSTTTQYRPELVAFSVTAVTAGFEHSLFIKSDGSLWGMGYNAGGQLGTGTTNDQHSPVMIVPNNVVAVAAGGYHSLFIKSDGTLWAMGFNHNGQLGDGTYANRLTPVQVMPPAPPRPGITNLSLSGLNVVLNGTNGQSGRTYNTLMSTNVSLPVNQWTLVGISSLSADGDFSITATNAVSPNYSAEFFLLQLQN